MGATTDGDGVANSGAVGADPVGVALDGIGVGTAVLGAVAAEPGGICAWAILAPSDRPSRLPDKHAKR